MQEEQEAREQEKKKDKVHKKEQSELSLARSNVGMSEHLPMRMELFPVMFMIIHLGRWPGKWRALHKLQGMGWRRE